VAFIRRERISNMARSPPRLRGRSQILLDVACLRIRGASHPVMDAVRVELEAIAFRDELKNM
jgi:hypothetical protein